MFLNPRNSQVDVVQSVGRVMRTAPGKDYGSIILPVGIPTGQSPEQALKDSKRYKVIWSVLNALRSHDDRFEAKINKIVVPPGEVKLSYSTSFELPVGWAGDLLHFEGIDHDDDGAVRLEGEEVAEEVSSHVGVGGKGGCGGSG